MATSWPASNTSCLPRGNNGLAIRYPGNGDTAYVGMCEIQVLDDTAKQYAKLDPRQYNGSVYGMVPAQRGYLRPVGEWNFEEVTVKGPKIQVELNGTVIVDADVSKIDTYMANSPHPGKTALAGTSASRATTIRWRFAMCRLRVWMRDKVKESKTLDTKSSCTILRQRFPPGLSRREHSLPAKVDTRSLGLRPGLSRRSDVVGIASQATHSSFRRGKPGGDEARYYFPFSSRSAVLPRG